MPETISNNPIILKVFSCISRIFTTQLFIFSGKVKYGRPSIIMTIPITHRKYFIYAALPLIFYECNL